MNWTPVGDSISWVEPNVLAMKWRRLQKSGVDPDEFSKNPDLYFPETVGQKKAE